MREQEKELFQGYEIRNWNYSSRLYKILAAAAFFNLLAIFTVGQTNLLTRKGCDSPFVNRVCQVIDTVYVGSMLLGTDSGYVDKDYVKTELEDADITYVDVSGQEPPLSYPEGYFALANPGEFAAQQNAMNDFPATTIAGIPGITTNPTVSNGTDLTATPQTLPPVNNKPVIGPLPDSPFGNNPIAANPTLKNRRFPRNLNPTLPKISDNSPKKLPELGGDTTAEKKPEDKPTTSPQPEIKSDPVAEVEINKKPFEDLGDTINDKLAKNQVDLSKPFLVVMDGTITADGKLDPDPKKSRFVKTQGDEQMILVAKSAIEAIGQSGFLGHLKNNGIDRVNFTIVQDEKQIYIKIISDQKTPEKAGTTASGLNNLLSLAKLADENGFKKLDVNSKTLIDNSKATSEGKNFVLNFALPKQDAQDIINRALKDRAEKKANQQPNSTAQTDNANQKTAK